jgi:hypothetical protein
LHLAAIRHPTWPESGSADGSISWEQATGQLLRNWNQHLPALRDHVPPDTPVELRRYGQRWKPGDLVEIPAGDLPAGAPAWWRSLEAWADRTGRNREAKRATLTVTVPDSARPWHHTS